MDDSTNTLLYTATYVFIFIIALSLSIGLYLTVNKYADSAFEYKQGLSGSIINTGSTGLEQYQTGETPLTKSDVFSYYVNYVKKDLYADSSVKQDRNYIVTIKDKNDNNISSDEDYNTVYNNLAENYVLKYKNESSGYIYIDIIPKT